jgi:protein FAM32A
MGKVGGPLKLKQKKLTDSKVQKTETVTQATTAPVKLLVTQKTSAQLAFEAAQKKKQQEKLPLLASKSHKEKVAEFNEYLGKLSEHHDIPKVGPG